MDQGQQSIGYDQWMPQPLQERIKLFNEISAENRALLVKTHIERWLATNRPRLTHEQIAVVNELGSFVTPDKYRGQQDEENLARETEPLLKKAEAVFSRDELRQILTQHADYVPPVEVEND